MPPVPVKGVGTKTAPRRAGRPPRALLGHAQITRAALRLVTRDGYKALTMSGLAKSLNVAPSALYNHVSSKQDVLLLVEDALMGRVDVSAFTERPWEEAVRLWAHSYRDVFSAHLPLIPVIALLPVTNAPQTITMYEAVTDGFLRAGWPQERIINAIVALESFVFGSAYDVNAPGDIFATGELEDAAPHFTAAVARRGNPAGHNDADAAFALGLDAMVAGLAATLASATR
ncbi:TetR family transcriptional regulator [Arthrobacter livingstonensis]|uniref:TetR family transcriptional regulator n=1 Tax=Arthrobacter livingstonensis TaxID=670078 RepID=A0A2V5LU81_9MICC|nr:TetR/AcrR family transcriptional regulator [Arthrobacter livingstonensis]PYI66877.1 TetR family transcriptional regulator [Arthrobacter livingstonensis]